MLNLKPVLIIIAAFSFLITASCSSQPLRLTEEEWKTLSPQQQIDAREKQAKIDLERQKLAAEREKIYLKQKKQLRKEEREQDIAQGLIAEFYPDNYICFGGDKCHHRSNEEKRNEVVISLRTLTNIDYIQIYADDRIGHKHDAIMGVSVDHYKVKSFDISKRTKWYQIFVGRPARNIVLRAETDDEIRLYRVKVFGSRISNDQLKYKYNISN